MIATLFASTLLAQETLPELTSNRIEENLLIEVAPERGGLFYIKMEASDASRLNPIPGVGFGWRIYGDKSALDISFSAIYGKHHHEYFTFPKANLYFYTNGDETNSLYLGGGLAWGSYEAQEKDFMGIVPNLTLGYEINRKGMIGSFIQIEVSQPAIPAYSTGGLPGPFAELSIGAGF